MGPNLAELDKAGPNKSKHLPKRVAQGKTRFKRVKCGLTVVIRGKLGYNWIDLG